MAIEKIRRSHDIRSHINALAKSRPAEFQAFQGLQQYCDSLREEVENLLTIDDPFVVGTLRARKIIIQDSTPQGTAEDLTIITPDGLIRAQLGLGGANANGILSLKSATGSIASVGSNPNSFMFVALNNDLDERFRAGINANDTGEIKLTGDTGDVLIHAHDSGRIILTGSSGSVSLIAGSGGDHSLSGTSVDLVISNTGDITPRVDDTADLGSASLQYHALYLNDGVYVDGTRVLQLRQPAVADPAGGSTVDTECRAQLGLLLTRLRVHGIIAAA